MSSAPRGLARGQPTRCPCAAYASGHPVAEHLDTGQTTPQASRWLACTEGCGAELELRLLHPPWPGARPADTVPACRICIGSPVAEHLDTGQTTPQASRWLACTGGCGYELELRVLHPTWPGARPADTVPACRICIRSPLSRSTSTLDRPHLKPRGGCLAQRAVAMSSSCGCCTPHGLARCQPTRCPRAAYASGRPVAEHLDTGQTTPQASRWVALHRGLWR